jgi:hypothetical protein
MMECKGTQERLSAYLEGVVSPEERKLVEEGYKVRVYVPYQGSNPEEVERLITRQVEEIMGTVPGIKSISSNSSSSGSRETESRKTGTWTLSPWRSGSAWIVSGPSFPVICSINPR